MIEFTAIFGDDIRTVRLNQSSGTNGFYQIMIGDYYQGQIIYQLDGWHVPLNDKSELNSDDCAILIEIVQQHENKKPG